VRRTESGVSIPLNEIVRLSQGVTIPSQRRYVEYYASLVQEDQEYQPVSLEPLEIKLEPLPVLNGAQSSK